MKRPHKLTIKSIKIYKKIVRTWHYTFLLEQQLSVKRNIDKRKVKKKGIGEWDRRQRHVSKARTSWLQSLPDSIPLKQMKERSNRGKDLCSEIKGRIKLTIGGSSAFAVGNVCTEQSVDKVVDDVRCLFLDGRHERWEAIGHSFLDLLRRGAESDD